MQNMLSKLWERVQELMAYLCQWAVIAFVVATLGAHVFFWITCTFLAQQTEGWQAERMPLDAIDESECVAAGDQAGACHRLVEQIAVASHRAEHHFWIMRFYQIGYFGLLATAYWSGTLAAALLVLITKKGWDDADDRLKGLFLGLTLSAAFFGGFPGLIKAKENIEGNKKAYLGYDNLIVEVRSFLVANDRPEVATAAYVHEVDEHLQSLNGIYFDLDESKVDLGRTRLLESTKDIE